MPIYAPRYDCTTCYPIYPPVHTYRHRGRWPPPEPKPVLHSLPRTYVQVPQANPARTQYVDRGDRGWQTERDGRRVRFADRPIVIDLPNYPPPRDIPATPAPSRHSHRSRSPPRNPTATRPPPQAPTSNATRAPPRTSTSTATRPPLVLSAAPPNTRPTTATRIHRTPSAPAQTRDHRFATASSLHDLLASFPSGLWDMRRNARPAYHPHYEPRYAEPVFPHDPHKRSLKLYFLPCGRTEFSWIAKVKADCSLRNHLTVNDVLETISTELFRRSACRDLYEGHPCYAKVRAAHRVRTRRGYTKRPHYDDAIRNVDLYHIERGQALYFKGLRPERLRGGEVVYLVKFSYA